MTGDALEERAARRAVACAAELDRRGGADLSPRTRLRWELSIIEYAESVRERGPGAWMDPAVAAILDACAGVDWLGRWN